MIDWNRVAELKEQIGEEDFAEVAEMFIAEVEGVIDRMRATATPEQYEEDLHFLKSSALNLGFSELAAMCQDGETRSAAGAAHEVELAPIFDCYAASKSEFLGR